MTTAPLSNDARAIEELRSKLGGRLTIVGHHYEQEATIQHCDIRGDSLELARRVPGIASDYIVFCGVYFMAESAALLAREGQQVLLPDHSADCVMAQMTPARLLDRVLGRLTASGRKLVPLAYVNTSLAVKAVVGRYGGAVCTSANAEKMMNWAFRQGDGVLFLPDKNLARNTARKLGITGRDTHILDVRKTGEAVDLEAADKAALVLWPGLCAIHARFHPGQIEAVRKADPSCKVIVHPECSPEVVRAADGAGSTTYIIEYVRNAPDGAHIYVGTEINLVERLAREQEGRIRVEALRSSACSHKCCGAPGSRKSAARILRSSPPARVACPITWAPRVSSAVRVAAPIPRDAPVRRMVAIPRTYGLCACGPTPFSVNRWALPCKTPARALPTLPPRSRISPPWPCKWWSNSARIVRCPPCLPRALR